MKDDHPNDKEREEEEEGKKPKFKVVDRRRINADEIEASDEPPEPEPEPEAPAESEKEPVDEKKEKKKEEEEKPEAPKEETKTKGDGRVEGAPEGGEDPLSYRNIVMSFLQTLVTVVWVHLGLVPHPQTQLVMKRLEEARKAIDLFETIYNAVEGDIPEQVKPEIKRLLEDMKANYIDQL
jgi:hypothetical protein